MKPLDTLTASGPFSPGRFWSDAPTGAPWMDAQDALADMEDSLSDRYSFHLGEMLGVHRLVPLEAWPSSDMERGYREGLCRTAQRADLYMRKLLSVRVSAYRRRLPVGSGFTVEYLRAIDVEVCPVSGVRLSKGSREDTDWSIDRLDNSLGYVPGNICVVSSRVNRLKGILSLEEMMDQLARVTGGQQSLRLSDDLGAGLSLLEALRLSALVAGPACFARGALLPYPPFAAAPGVWSVPTANIAAMHVRCARSVLDFAADEVRRSWFKRLGSATWRTSNVLVKWLASGIRGGEHPCDLWLSSACSELLLELEAAFLAAPPGEAKASALDGGEQAQLDAIVAVRSYERVL